MKQHYPVYGCLYTVLIFIFHSSCVFMYCIYVPLSVHGVHIEFPSYMNNFIVE